MTSTPELVKHRFAEELTRCCGSYYKAIPSNEQFARDFYLSSKYSLKVSRETVRKWFRGDSFPDLDHLLHLIDWLGLNMAAVFIKSDHDRFEVASSSVNMFNQKSISQISIEQIDFMLDILNSIKKSENIQVNNFD
jgi:transcriptional regulator with XRE-family HTH domain